MKISTFILTFCGSCIFYICNADWIDELIEDYLGTEYEEVAPFISSVTAGTEEFDQLVEELARSKRRWWLPYSPYPLILATALSVLFAAFLIRRLKPRQCSVANAVLQFFSNFRKSGTEREEIQTVVAEYLERKLKQLCGNKQSDDVPVKLLWKGGTLVESSIHCNIRDESKFRHVRRHLLQSKLLFEASDSGGGESVKLVPSYSETETARKMAEIRKLLESEQELEERKESSFRRVQSTPEEEEGHGGEPTAKFRKCWNEVSEHKFGKQDRERKEEVESRMDADCDGSPDPKLMNRIRLLESRLRLEELKNKNWISRMSRAEGILQQLNKQVERIEESRPVGTLTETLKITSTVTNWPPSVSHPRRNVQFTLVDQYPPFSVQAPYTSLSELIQKEVGLPTAGSSSKNPFQLPPSPQIPALPTPTVLPQSSFLSKFLCR